MRRAFLSSIAIALLAPLASPQADREYQVKAVFLFNFLKFVEWPVSLNDLPWVIGVLGHDPFGEVLDHAVRNKTVNGRPVEVRRYAKAGDVKDCNILFVGRAGYERTGTPVEPGLLTVGEDSGFIKSGGIINFYIEDNRVHFEIRPSVAHAVGLHVSARLLKLGRAL